MARDEAPPFGRGETFFNGGTTDSTSGQQHEGKVWEFEDIDYTPGTVGAKPARTNRSVKCMVVRNASGGALLPKRVAKMQTSNSPVHAFTGQVQGYAGVGDFGFPIDEFLPAAGVPANDLFWVVVEGPAKVTTAASGTTTIPVGAFAIAAANGFVVAQDTTVITAPGIYAQIQSAIGRSIDGVAAISTDFLLQVGKDIF